MLLCLLGHTMHNAQRSEGFGLQQLFSRLPAAPRAHGAMEQTAQGRHLHGDATARLQPQRGVCALLLLLFTRGIIISSSSLSRCVWLQCAIEDLLLPACKSTRTSNKTTC
jgi:hypothetical protein